MILRILAAFILNLSLHSSAYASYLVVFDLDRVLISSANELPNGFSNDDVIVRAGSEDYRVTRYTPEFLWFLRNSLARSLGENVELAVFSAGTLERNTEAALRLGIVSHDEKTNRIKNFSDLLHVESGQTLRNIDERSLGELKDSIARKGGQEKMPFFNTFKKDLSIFNHDLRKVIILEDNFNAVPRQQQANLILVARWDVDETAINLRDRDLAKHWQIGPPLPKQVMRSELSLVRIAGLLSLAAEDFRIGLAPSLPEALFRLQWRANGRFRTDFANSQSVMLEGERTLRVAKKKMLRTGRSNVSGRTAACESLFLSATSL